VDLLLLLLLLLLLFHLISFMLGLYKYISETNHIARMYNVATILWSQNGTCNVISHYGTCNVIPHYGLFILPYYYYYHHHHHHFSLFHNNLAGSQNSNGLTDVALLILCSAKLADCTACAIKDCCVLH
jgi:hypothetical protein